MRYPHPTCARKIKFTSEKLAVRHMEAMLAKIGRGSQELTRASTESLNVYLCQHCRFYHVGRLAPARPAYAEGLGA